MKSKIFSRDAAAEITRRERRNSVWSSDPPRYLGGGRIARHHDQSAAVPDGSDVATAASLGRIGRGRKGGNCCGRGRPRSGYWMNFFLSLSRRLSYKEATS